MEKIKLIARIKLVNKGGVEEGKQTLSVEVDSVDVLLDGDVIDTDPDVEVDIIGVEE